MWSTSSWRRYAEKCWRGADPSIGCPSCPYGQSFVALLTPGLPVRDLAVGVDEIGDLAHRPASALPVAELEDRVDGRGLRLAIFRLPSSPGIGDVATELYPGGIARSGRVDLAELVGDDDLVDRELLEAGRRGLDGLLRRTRRPRRG